MLTKIKELWNKLIGNAPQPPVQEQETKAAAIPVMGIGDTAQTGVVEVKVAEKPKRTRKPKADAAEPVAKKPRKARSKKSESSSGSAPVSS